MQRYSSESLEYNCPNQNSKFKIPNNLGWGRNMDIKRVAKDTSRVLASYLTYQAVQLVINQLAETNPPLAIWLSHFSGQEKIQDGEVYIEDLLHTNHELAFRVMTVREHLAQEVTDFLPEMVRSSIQQTNMMHRRQYLERVTQLGVSDSSPPSEQQPDSNSND